MFVLFFVDAQLEFLLMICLWIWIPKAEPASPTVLSPPRCWINRVAVICPEEGQERGWRLIKLLNCIHLQGVFDLQVVIHL